MSRAVVLGGGFAGIESAIQLRKLGVPTTLVSDRDYGWIYPISIWIPTGDMKPEGAKISLAALAKKHGFDLIIDPVQAIDTARHKVQLESLELDYDYLMIAVGGTKLKPKGAEHTFTICGAPDDTVRLRDRMLEVVARGGGKLAFGFGGNPKDPSAVRGGPVFEVMLNVDHWLRKKGLRDQFEIHFFAPMPRPGKKMGQEALESLEMFYDRAGIERHVGTKITHFTEGQVHYEGEKEPLNADLIVFVPGGKGLPMFREAGLPLNAAGYIETDDKCRVNGLDNVWAVGDSAALQGPEFRAKQGHVAEIMARIGAIDLARVHESGGGARCNESYVEHVNVICLMDTGGGGAMVKRDLNKASLLPLPVVGHWMKQAWGHYWKLSKLGRIPRLPGM